MCDLLLLLFLHPATRISDKNIEFSCSSLYLSAELGTNHVRDDGAMCGVLGGEHLKVRKISNDEWLETIGEHPTYFRVCAITNIRVWSCSTFLAALPSINTTWISPRRTHTNEYIGLETSESLGAFMDNGLM